DLGASESKVIVRIPASTAWLTVGVSAWASMAETARPSTLREMASSIMRFWSGICADAGPAHEAWHVYFAAARFMPGFMGAQHGEMPLVMIWMVTGVPEGVLEAVPPGAVGPPGGGEAAGWFVLRQEASERPPARSRR